MLPHLPRPHPDPVPQIKNNAAVGAEIAAALQRADRGVPGGGASPAGAVPSPAGGAAAEEARAGDGGAGAGPRVVVLGGCCEDVEGVSSGALLPETSSPGRARASFGGVGRNVAHALALLGSRVALVSAVGDDAAGAALRAHARAAGVDVSGVRVVGGAATARFVAVLGPDGDLAASVADMAVLDTLGEAAAEQGGAPLLGAAALRGAGMLVLDGNLPPAALCAAMRAASAEGVPVFLEPTSVPKAAAAAAVPGVLAGLHYTSPNLLELRAMALSPRTFPARPVSPLPPASLCKVVDVPPRPPRA
jgi:sugar/nucleoside kinase (ribokinase family)